MNKFWTRAVWRDCSYGRCPRNATVEIMNGRTFPVTCGVFCRVHARMRLRELRELKRDGALRSGRRRVKR